jgi:hypothetical protein
MIMWSERLSHKGSMTFSRHWIERFDAVHEPLRFELRGRRQQIHRAVGVLILWLAGMAAIAGCGGEG